MKRKMPVLRICMFGRTIITYGKKPVPFGKKGITKAQKLLMIMCYNGFGGIARNKLLEDFFGREDVLDMANNLRVTAHRLERQMMDAGLPKHDYVTVKDGIYTLSCPMEVEVDALIFKELIAQAEQTSDKEERKRLLIQACELYRGEFLEEMSDAEWVLLESVRFKKIYQESMLWLCEYLKEKEEYEEIIRLCALASQIYPFDEWQAVKIDCYISQNRFKEAYREYKDTEKLLLEELGVSPSQRMLDQLAAIRDHLRVSPVLIRDIKESLKEQKAVEGAYYCSLPSFRDEYRFACRIMERNKMDLYLMLCTIINAKGYPQEDDKLLAGISEKLHDAIKQSLRRCDTFTQYSPSQFLILLAGIDGVSCKSIFERIVSRFSKEDKTFRSFLQCDAFPVEETEGETPRILRGGVEISPEIMFDR